MGFRPSSTGPALHLRLRPLTVALATAAGLGATSCSAPKKTAPEIGVIRHVDRVEASPVSPAVRLAGGRCASDGICQCRGLDNPAEDQPPASGWKRFEFRLAADGGDVTLASSAWAGLLKGSGASETCFYVDLAAGAQPTLTLQAQARDSQSGLRPHLSIAEYGPAGPFWYDIIRLDCQGHHGEGRCDQDGIHAWNRSWQAQRKRGRLEPCGSAAVKAVDWQTSGGLSERDGGFYRDLTVTFILDIKSFAPMFAPGSTECIPK